MGLGPGGQALGIRGPQLTRLVPFRVRMELGKFVPPLMGVSQGRKSPVGVLGAIRPECVADGERSVGWVYVIPTRRQCIWVRAIGYCLAYLLPR
jgi:hypothetical protein